jgi:hypothetical protein
MTLLEATIEARVRKETCAAAWIHDATATPAPLPDVAEALP